MTLELPAFSCLGGIGETMQAHETHNKTASRNNDGKADVPPPSNSLAWHQAGNEVSGTKINGLTQALHFEKALGRNNLKGSTNI